MSINIQKIRYHPDSILRKKASNFDHFTENADVAQKMLQLMYASHGIGLAANQVGLLLRCFVMDTSPDQTRPIFFGNPIIVEKTGPLQKITEGCLSIPGLFHVVNRPSKVLVQYVDAHGAEQEQWFEGLDASCIQHEIDHLDGILFPDRITSPTHRDRLWKRYVAPKG